MKVRIEKALPLPGSAEAAWELLQDIEAVAECMPGARITERVDAQHYKGTVTVKMGPANLAFRGEIEVREVDAAARSLRLLAKGTDSTGTSAAAMELTARVEPAGGATSRLAGAAEVTLSGKVAAFGARLANPMADKILEQFAANFAARVAQRPVSQAAAGAPAAPQARELDALALAWAAFKAWLRGLFSRKAA